jgi:hypothetical protein
MQSLLGPAWFAFPSHHVEIGLQNNVDNAGLAVRDRIGDPDQCLMSCPLGRGSDLSPVGLSPAGRTMTAYEQFVQRR